MRCAVFYIFIRFSIGVIRKVRGKFVRSVPRTTNWFVISVSLRLRYEAHCVPACVGGIR